jgi:hypothetical protein
VLSVFVNKFNNTAWWYVAVCSTAPFVVPGWFGRVRGSARSSSSDPTSPGA